MANFPIPKDFGIYRDSLIAKVKEIMAVKLQNPNHNISNLNQEIDSIVYKIFNLTDEEIVTVEGDI